MSNDVYVPKASKGDANKIAQIVDRALPVLLGLSSGVTELDVVSINMDLTACHETCPLDLDRMLEAEPVDLLHDIAGIWRNLDRAAGTLLNHFRPRFARGSE